MSTTGFANVSDIGNIPIDDSIQYFSDFDSDEEMTREESELAIKDVPLIGNRNNSCYTMYQNYPSMAHATEVERNPADAAVPALQERQTTPVRGNKHKVPGEYYVCSEN